MFQELEFELRVVTDDDASDNALEDGRSKVAEGGRIQHVTRGNPMHVGASHVAAGIDQGTPRILATTVPVKPHDPDFDYPILHLRVQTGRLEVDDRVARHFGAYLCCSRIVNAGNASTICMVSRLTVTMRARRSRMYLGSPTSRDQSLGLLTIPEGLSVLM